MNSKLKKLFPQVRKVEDAKDGVMIEVTKEDAKTSKRYKHSECAMAVACKRKFEVDGVLIARSISYLVKGDTAIRFNTPESVSREVTSFDRGAGFEPGVYHLAKPQNKIEWVNKGGNKPKTGKGKKPKYHHFTENIREVLGSAAD